VMVRKAQPLAGSLQELREALAPLIPEAQARETFLAGPDSRRNSTSRPRTTSGAPSGAPTSGAPLSRSVPVNSRSAPLEHSSNTGLSRHSGPTHRIGGTPSARQMDLTADEIAAVELALSKFIGPMAKMLVKREMGRHSSLTEFAAAVTHHVDPPAQREPFQQALKKALPKRSF